MLVGTLTKLGFKINVQKQENMLHFHVKTFANNDLLCTDEECIKTSTLSSCRRWYSQVSEHFSACDE